MDSLDPVGSLAGMGRLDRSDLSDRLSVLNPLNRVSSGASLNNGVNGSEGAGSAAAARSAAGAGSVAGGLAAFSIPEALQSKAVSQEDKIRIAAREFESMLVRQMIKSMRDTVPEGGLLSKNSGEEMFQDFMDQELAKNLSGKMGLGLSDSLLRQLGGSSQGAGKPSASGDAKNEHEGEKDNPEVERRANQGRAI